MRYLALILLLVAAPAWAEDIAVPSGQPVTLAEVIEDDSGPFGAAHRYRFVTPDIAREGGTVDPLRAAEDILALCEGFVLPRLAKGAPLPDQVIISLSDRPVPFGQPAPDATQFFEAFRIENGSCVWEEF